jgi:hypothetical protein
LAEINYPKGPLALLPQQNGQSRAYLTAHKRYAGKGRPTASTPLKAIEWQIQAHVLAVDKAMERDKQAEACYVLGTNIDASELSDTEVIVA